MKPADNMNVLDSIISFFSPSWGLRREVARQTLSRAQERAYEAAAYGRRTSNWWASGSSATTEAGAAIKRLRDRSREMVRNNQWANKAVSVIANNVVGTGIRPAVSIANDNARTKKLAKRIKAEWNKWADNSKCDFDGRLNFYGLQNLIMRAVAESGECLIVKYVDAKTQTLKIRLLEADYIDHNKHTVGQEGRGQDFDFYGVRFNKDGQRIGVWLYDRHPENGSDTSTLYDESQVIHVFEVLRPGQARGVPMGVSGFLRLRDLNDYEDAQLMRQKVAACFSVFVKKNGTGMPSSGGASAKESELEAVEPGQIQYLELGEDVVFGTPPPADGYDSYMRTVLRGIAAGYGITYEALTNDLSNVNFSSGRMGWLDYARTVAKQQRDIMQPALEKVFEWFIGILALSQGISEQVVAEWTLPRREMIDPVKETNAMILQIQAGLKSYSETLRELGYDPDDTMEEIKAFNDKADALKLILSVDMRQKLQQDKTAGSTTG